MQLHLVFLGLYVCSVCVCVCVCAIRHRSAADLGRQPAVSLWKEPMAHSDQYSGRVETTHTPHTNKARSQLLDLHPVPTRC